MIMGRKDPLSPTVDPGVAAPEDNTLRNRIELEVSVQDRTEPLGEQDQQIAHWILKMPDLEAPPGLLPSVMGSLQPKKAPWPRRIALWAKSPKSFTFTPIRVAPAAMVLVGILILSGYWLFGQKNFGFNPGQTESQIPVVFNLAIPEARAVAVVGTFNGWKPKGFEMTFDREKKTWSLTVRLPEGRYEYAFLVDDQKVLPDPEASLYQNDGFGNENSVMILRAKDEKIT
jgi:hypothetical protein